LPWWEVAKRGSETLEVQRVINSVFYNGKLVTLEMKAEKKLDKAINNK